MCIRDSSYLPGFRNYLAGIVPSKPGFYLRSDVVYYSGTAPRVVLNGQPVENISVDAALGIIEPEYVFPWKIFGANHAVVITQLYNLSLIHIFSRLWAISVRSDIGGFGVGSDFTWNLVLLAGYRTSGGGQLLFGYRILDVDREKGSGADFFKFDVTYSGPMLGYSFNF